MTTADAPKTAAEPKTLLPKGFDYPPPPFELIESLDDVLCKLIREYLPPVWADAVITWGIVYAITPDDTHNSMADYAGWIEDLQKLLEYLAGVRRDEKGHVVDYVGPVPKLGKAIED